MALGTETRVVGGFVHQSVTLNNNFIKAYIIGGSKDKNWRWRVGYLPFQ
jgi:hypothetical protein